MGNCMGDVIPPDPPQPRTQAQKRQQQQRQSNGNTNPPPSTVQSDPPPPPSSSAAVPAAVQSSAVARKAPVLLGGVLGRAMEDIKGSYTLGRELGRGQFGVTYLCTQKGSGEQFACKSISKRKLSHKEDIDDVRREVQIMHHLIGQPNVVELKGAYEDRQAIHLVMELCSGGELFDRIIARGHYSERAAASVTKTILEVVQTCHSLGVIHRDLKPENFLLLNNSETSPLKATDFGLSVFFKPGETFKDVVGSAYYVAPEVLKRNYGPEVDIWSAGVILYILLCGVPPFWAETEQGIFEAVLKGGIDFSSNPWPSISSDAKDLVKKILTHDPKQRLTAQEALDHPWIKEDGLAPDKPIDNAVMSRMKQFRAMNKLKKLALKVIAASLSEEEIMGLKEMFKSMDTDNSGTITFEELKFGLARQGTHLPDSEIRQIMEAADVDGNGTIDYSEFITATLHMNKMDKEDRLYSAFQYFDEDNSGYITMEELEQALIKHGMGDKATVREIISEVDADNDGRINYDEFVSMMRKGAQPLDANGIHEAPVV